MKIHFERSGGFAGISTVVPPIDSHSLSSGEQDELRDMVNRAKFFELPKETPLPKKGADYYKYTITIEDDENKRSHTIKTNDETLPPELGPLVDYLESKIKRMF
jgi:hypothetical protein